MIHVTCLAHGLHRVAETIRNEYSEVDKFVFATKNVLSKSAARRRVFHDTLPNIPLPPDPVRTRWGTWLRSVIYYAKYFEEVKTFFLS